MSITLIMPKLSPTMEEGTIVSWIKKEGERVEAGDVLFEVSTDKATVEHTAIDEGWLHKILVEEGHNAAVNQPVAILAEEEGEKIEEASESEELDNVGQPEKKAPRLEKELLAKEDRQKLASLEALPATTPQGRILASPLAKKLAKEKNIDLSQVKGSGPDKRVMSRDLKLAVMPHKLSADETSLEPLLETLSPMRKVIAQRLQEAKSTIPHFYVQLTIDAAPLVQFREQLKAFSQPVSINDCIIKACALALESHPEVNSGFNAKDNTLLRFQSIDVAVAVSIEGGLLTPIVKLANKKSLKEISTEIKSLAKKAKEGKLAPGQFQGGSFTVSNLGMYGISDFQAIINPPQAAILAVSGILEVPVVKNGAIVPGKTMNLTLSVDHRVIDGVAAAKYLNSLKGYLENPMTLLFT